MKNRKKALTFRLILATIIGIIITGIALYLKSVYINLKSLFLFIQILGILISVISAIFLLMIFVDYLYDVMFEDWKEI